MLLSDPEIESSILISSDEGATYQKYRLNFYIQSLLFHPKQEEWILAYSLDQKVSNWFLYQWFLSQVFKGIVSRTTCFQRWWRNYGVLCCSHLAVLGVFKTHLVTEQADWREWTCQLWTVIVMGMEMSVVVVVWKKKRIWHLIWRGAALKNLICRS